MKRTIVAVAALLAGIGLVYRHFSAHASTTATPASSEHPASNTRLVAVPRTTERLALDGELTEPSWRTTPVTRFLGADGKDGRPYSEVRFLWSDDGVLHVGLYASDRNIVSAGVGDDGPVWRGDSFHLVLSKDGVEHSFDVGPTAHGAVLTDGERKGGGAWNYAWQSGAHVALDMDEGTPDDPSTADEEWVIELDIPLASIGLAPRAGEQVAFAARRCDVDRRAQSALDSMCSRLDLRLDLAASRPP